MTQETMLKNSLLATWTWFHRSKVMIPEDGTWGVAERVFLTEGNEATEKALANFPTWMKYKDHYIFEHRRADCNLETAFLFLKMHEVFGNKLPFRKTAENILDFLYFRSALLNHDASKPSLYGTWCWSHAERKHYVWFDDNAWMAILALKIARAYPALDRRYKMTHYAMALADLLAAEAPKYWKDVNTKGEIFSWVGPLDNPHWGSLVCAALAEAARKERKKAYTDFIFAYEKMLLEKADQFDTSATSYAILGLTASYKALKEESTLKCAKIFADRLVRAMDPETGNIPSEHWEAPSGTNLADTVYTMNWAALALQNMAALDPRYRAPFEKILSLLLKIQDRTRKAYLFGCWRGMFDLDAGVWGGGDRYEGGANSIYTGWTNAPIGWVCAFTLLKSNLMES